MEISHRFSFCRWPVSSPAMALLTAAIFLLAASPPGSRLLAQNSSDEPVFTARVTDVRVDVQVLQNNEIVNGLTKDDFIVSDEGRPRPIDYFGHDSEPVSLILLLDISGSMRPWIEQMSSTAREALSYLRPGDRVAILVFGKTVAVHQEFSDNLADSARQIASAVRNHDVGVTTAINSAVASAAEYMQKNARAEGRRAILILTDNLSLSYKFPDEKVIRELDRADTVLNAIVVGRGIRPGPPKPGANPDITPADVFKLAEETGGDAILAEHPAITFPQMVERIRTRYTLAYHQPVSMPGEFRRISVTLTDAARQRYPQAEVRARRGYWAQ